MNNLESFTDFHKRQRMDCIEYVENYLRGKHFEAVELCSDVSCVSDSFESWSNNISLGK